MMWPPSVLRIRVTRAGRNGFRLWLPLFLVWPAVLALCLALFPVAVLVAVALWREGHGKAVLLAGPLAFGFFCALRGLSIEKEGAEGSTCIRFW